MPPRADSDRPAGGDTAPRPSLGVLSRQFLVLGLTSFGGPIAHLGMMREACIVRRRWLTDHTFADILSLAQLLPGPTSSQVAFGIGLWLRGLRGAVAAATCFALPGALVLTAAGLVVASSPALLRAPWLRGLMAFGTAVVAIAVYGMVKRLTHGNAKGCIAAVAFLTCAAVAEPIAGAACVAFGLVAGALLCPKRSVDGAEIVDGSPTIHWLATLAALLVVVAALLLPLLPSVEGLPIAVRLPLALAQSGSLVFGGGHVVLPMIAASAVEPGLVDAETFVAGYSFTQAMPGPLFNVSAYLGAAAIGAGGATLCLMAIFLPGMGLMAASLPVWSALRHSCRARRALDGAGAAVTGVLLWAVAFVLVPEVIGTSVSLAILAVACVVALARRIPLPLVAAAAAGVAALAQGSAP